MATYRFRLLNVFAEERFGGNPLCVFEDARGLADADMQALALQFNLSETTFILPSDRATARVRIFTPAFEMPFAGHPTLGTAHVVRALRGGERLTLEEKAGVIPVTAEGDRWTLRANPPTFRPASLSSGTFAEILGLPAADVGEPPLWVNTGSEQLVIPLRSADAVRRCRPVPTLMARAGKNADGEEMAYVWAKLDEKTLLVRFFFPKNGGELCEDPATGSAAADLGGWFIATGAKLPQKWTLLQGEAVGRNCRLYLEVDASKNIFVTGNVVEIGSGTVTI